MTNENPNRLIDQYRHAFEDAVFGVALVYPDGRWLKVNEAFSNLIGYPPEELYSIDFQSITHPDDLEGDIEWITRVMGGENSILNREKRYIHKDGHYIWINLICSLYRDEKGEPGYFIAQIIDITETKAQQERLIQARKEAEKANQAKSDFLSSMSHELRTPLNSILGFAQLLNVDSNGENTKENHACIEQIMKGGQHLLELINEILELPKIESGTLEMSIETVSAQRVIDECQHFVTPLTNKAKLEFSVDTFEDENNVFLTADQKRLKQVLINILSNAIKYNKKGGQIKISHKAQGKDFYRITVSDTGIGIPQERHSKVFEPFNRLGIESSNIAGTGIGLTISKKLIEQMNGEIGFESNEKSGSRFWINIPISREAKFLPPKKPYKVDKINFTNLEEKKFSALYIEDNFQNQELMELIFQSLPNADLVIAKNGSEGLKIAGTEIPDIILLDMGLPDIHGTDVATQLKTTSATANIPIIAVSANAMPFDVEMGEKAGLDAYVTKPLDISKLFEVLTTYLS